MLLRLFPTAQAYIDDISTPVARSRRFVLLGSASFVGYLAGPEIGTRIAGPIMRMPVGRMPLMVNWPAIAVALVGLPLLLIAPGGLGRRPAAGAHEVFPQTSRVRSRFVRASIGVSLLASFGVGTFEVGFTLFGGQTLGLVSSTMALMFVTCSLSMLAALSTLLLEGVRRRINQRWVAAAFGVAAWNPMAPFWASALVLVFGATVALMWWGQARDDEIAESGRGF